MTRRPSFDTLARAMLAINTLLLLLGMLTFREADRAYRLPDWSPVPRPAALDPFAPYRQPLT